MNAWCLSLLLAVQDAPGAVSCFPNEAAVDEFLAEWYCGQLAAAGFGMLTGDPSYRFAYLPSFHASRFVAVAIEAGRPVVRGVVLSGRGGYAPGKVARETRRVLTAEEWRLLLQRLQNAGMWEPTDKNDSSGVDGAQWLLEGRQDGKYRFHDVWSPTPARFPQYVKVCLHLLELAGIKPPDEEIY
jgi:hypothetical protein